MSERAGVGVAVGSVVVVSLRAEPGVPVISSLEAVVVVDARRLEKSSPTGMLNPGMSENAGTLVAVGEAVRVSDTSEEVLVATEVLDPPLLLLSSEESSPLIPPVAPVSLIRARASSWVVHKVLYTANGELRLFCHNVK